ncbi:MAG: hypothetical protein IKM27_03335 [Clostridia bacterium]|nr:hypothetical protein [Clostridia bacterium]MBQ2325524.1 hypothetical protein [Clostridia bacterium]MBR6776763.1 hypothetical protein [Clostridia bacterium]
MITCNKRYLYKINLDTAAQVTEFNRIASKCDGEVFLVSGTEMKLDAKSFLGAHLARIAWNDIWLETEKDHYEAFKQFMAE